MTQTNNNSTTKSVALLVAVLTSFVTPFLISGVNVALKTIGNEYSMSAVLLGWVSTVYLLASAAFLLPVGKLADIKGRKRIFLWGLGILSAASVLCALAPNTVLFLIFRGTQGIGAAFIYTTNVALLTSVYPAQERGRVLGINSGSIYLGLSIGPTLGGYLTSTLGWRSVFWITALLGLIAFFIAWGKLKGEWAEAAGEQLDWKGSILYGISLVVFMMGFPRLPTPQGIALILAGCAGLYTFIRWEGKPKDPVLSLALFRNNPRFTFSNLAALINYNSVTASGFLLSLYLQYIKGMSPQAAGLVLIAQPVMMSSLSPLAGRLSDRVEVRTLASVGMALSTAALTGFIFLTDSTPLWSIILLLVLLGTGYGFFASPNTNAVMGSVEPKSYAVAASILSTTRLIGQTLSIGISTLVFALYLGDNPITPAVYPQFLASLKPMYGVFSLLCFLGIFASLARGKREQPLD